MLHQHPSFQTERSESEQGSSWGSSPLTDSASPQLDLSDSLDGSCVYRQIVEPRSLCNGLHRERLHGATSGHAHAQGPSCEPGRCQAGRYFLGPPPAGREAWWGGARNRSVVCPAGPWDEDSTLSSPDGGSASDSGDRYQTDLYRCSPQESQHTIKEEEGPLHLRKSAASTPAGPAEGLPKVSTSRFSSEYCPGSLPQTVVCPGLGPVSSPVPSPLPGSRLSSPDLPPLSLPLRHPFGRPAPCSPPSTPASVRYSSHPRPYLDRHVAYSLTGYGLEHLYEPPRGCCPSASDDPTRYGVNPHLLVATEQTPGHKGTSVIITNGS